jgi:hypothetical protein
LTLFTKDYRSYLALDFATRKLVFLPWRVKRSFCDQLARVRSGSAQGLTAMPTIVGEVGIPFDLRGGEAYRTGDFALQVRAMDASLSALDDNLLSYALWNYTADNDNLRGDQWNGEDLSIFSRDQQADAKDINSGGRALEAVVRPYARATAGEPLRMHFDHRRRVFEFEFRHDGAVQAPTELFVPAFQYPGGCRVQVSDGTFELDMDEQVLTYWHGKERRVHTVRLTPL